MCAQFLCWQYFEQGVLAVLGIQVAVTDTDYGLVPLYFYMAKDKFLNFIYLLAIASTNIC